MTAGAGTLPAATTWRPDDVVGPAGWLDLVVLAGRLAGQAHDLKRTFTQLHDTGAAVPAWLRDVPGRLAFWAEVLGVHADLDCEQATQPPRAPERGGHHSS
jgi:hypothetical protein